MTLVSIGTAAAMAAGCRPGPQPGLPDCGPSGRCDYRVVERYPHDPQAFTQGLVYEAGFLYEGTGLRGQSTLRKVELETGQVFRSVSLDPQYFGEGIAIVGDRIVQLTFTSEVGFVYERDSFSRLREFQYSGEGWGLTYDGKHLIMSDGSSTLRLLDPVTFEEVGRIQVAEGGFPVDRLNELEYVAGEVFANVWQTDSILRISPDTGEVLAWIDLHGLLGADRFEPGVDVLNGIAYDPEGDRLFVTGKRWPWLFQIELIPASGS